MSKGKNKHSPYLGRSAHQEETKLTALLGKGLYAEAAREAEATLRRQPGSLFAQKALGTAYLGLQRFAESANVCRRLSQLSPNDWENWANLAYAERGLGHSELSFEAMHRAVGINQRSDELRSDLAGMYRQVNDHVNALKWFFAALELNPESLDHFTNWVGALILLRRFEDALSCLAGAWEDEKGNLKIAAQMFSVASNNASWHLYREAEALLLAQPEKRGFTEVAPLHAITSPMLDRFEQRKLLAGQVVETVNRVKPLPQKKPEDLVGRPSRRLRIGYLSADVHSHATMYLIKGVWLAHEQAGLDWYVYSYGMPNESEEKKAVEKAAAAFHEVRLMSDEDLAALIQADEIDILVDLKGWTNDYRGGVSLLHPAPVVATWLGYPGTLGHPRLADYVIGDAVVTPLEHGDAYSETLALMPHSYQPNDNQRQIGKTPSRAEVGLPENKFVFCSFNRFDKLTPDLFEAWCQILLGVPESVFWLLPDTQLAMKNIRDEASRMGVAPERFVEATRCDVTSHLGRLRLADLALDTFPYTSHTTGSDALWAGLPLLAIQGETFASRVSSSLLNAVGLPELITHSLDEFVSQAIMLAQHPNKLRHFREHLMSDHQKLPLFDTELFAKDLARLYQQMWDDFLHGRRQPIVLRAVE